MSPSAPLEQRELERFVAENRGQWGSSEWLEFKDRIRSLYGNIDEDQLAVALEKARRSYLDQSRSLEAAPTNESPVTQVEPPATQLDDELVARGIPRDRIEAILGAVRERLNRSPVIVFMGGTGVGKSTTCNNLFGQELFNLFGQELFKVSATAPETSEIQAREAGDLILVDVPGLGEGDKVRDQKWRKLYKRILQEGIRLEGKSKPVHADAIVWVLTANDRKLAVEASFYREVLKKICAPTQLKRVVYAINQVDIISPVHAPNGWNNQWRMPGPAQLVNIREKQIKIAAMFEKTPSQVIPYSAEQGYNLDFLLEEVIRALPKERRPFVVAKAEANDKKTGRQVVNKSTAEDARKSFWETVGETAILVLGKATDLVKKVAEIDWDKLRGAAEGIRRLFEALS
jgi:predicted GTPase